MLSEPLTVAGRPTEPYVHVDNRGLVVFDGQRGVVFDGATLGWVRETLELLIDEKRATRHRGDQFLGGWVDADGRSATLYAGPASGLVSLALPVESLSALLQHLRG